MSKIEVETVGVPVPVTICPPGRRSRNVVERCREISAGPPVTTATALQWPQKPSIVPPARNDRRTAQERVEAALRAEAVSVAIAQPHRQGSDDPRDGTPLGRYCNRSWPGPSREPWRNKMFAAGETYDQIIRDSKIALGLPYLGQAGGRDGAQLTEEQLEARKELALRRRKKADEALREVKYGLPQIMERFVYEHREPSPYDEDVIRHGLWKIADAFGLLEKGVHDGVDRVNCSV